jgi:hypothetical protein
MARGEGGGEKESKQLPAAIMSLWHTGLEFLAHAVLVMIMLAGFKMVHKFYLWLHPEDPSLWGVITMSAVFNFFDYLLIVGILAVGAYKVLRAYTKRD